MVVGLLIEITGAVQGEHTIMLLGLVIYIQGLMCSELETIKTTLKEKQ